MDEGITTVEGLEGDGITPVRVSLGAEGLRVEYRPDVGAADAGPQVAYVGIDNGVSGSIGLVTTWGRVEYMPMPTFECQDYCKAKKRIRRIDTVALFAILMSFGANVRAFLERPLKNPSPIFFNTTCSAMRSFEATIITLEKLLIGYTVVDSRGWQKEMLPIGTKGSPELKKASLEAGVRLFPKLRKEIEKQGDADGLLLAEWARRKQL